MSEENVELVRRLQPPPDVDLVWLFSDEGGREALADTLGPFLHEDVVIAGGGRISYLSGFEGLEGLAAGWADWLAPWESYRVEIEDAIDVGDHVVVLTRDFGRRPGMAAEVPVKSAAVWTVRDGKIASIRFYVDRVEALGAVGLRE